MACAIDDVLRSILDNAYSIPAQLGLHQYTVTLVTISNDGGSRPAVGGTRVRTETPLLIGGNQNPAVRHVSEQDITLSGDVLKDKDMVIGPIVLPYITPNCVDGYGTSINIFDPLDNNTNRNNLQIYFLIEGPGLAAAGNYFEKIYMVVSGSGSLSYNIYVRNLGSVIP